MQSVLVIGESLIDIVHGADAAVSGNQLGHTYPANSITLLALPQTSTSPAPTALTIAVAHSSVQHRAAITATGSLTGNGTGVAGQPVILEAQRTGETAWSSLATVTSGVGGSLRWSGTAHWSGSVRWRYAGSPAYAASTSPAASMVGRAPFTGQVRTLLAHRTHRPGGDWADAAHRRP